MTIRFLNWTLREIVTVTDYILDRKVSRNLSKHVEEYFLVSKSDKRQVASSSRGFIPFAEKLAYFLYMDKDPEKRIVKSRGFVGSKEVDIVSTLFKVTNKIHSEEAGTDWI